MDAPLRVRSEITSSGLENILHKLDIANILQPMEMKPSGKTL